MERVSVVIFVVGFVVGDGVGGDVSKNEGMKEENCQRINEE